MAFVGKITALLEPNEFAASWNKVARLLQLRDAGVTAIVDVAVSQSWSVTGVAGYSRLLGDYADSPIVSERGSEDQFFFGLALGRRF